MRVLRYLWALPATLLGLIVVVTTLLSGGRVQIVRGVIEACGGTAAWLLCKCTILPRGAAAMTLGHVVLGVDAAALEATREHERIHVAQYERWGPLFIPIYALASLLMLLIGRDPYRDNPFEREAFARTLRR